MLVKQIYLLNMVILCRAVIIKMTLQPTRDLDEVELDRLLRSIEPLPLANMQPLPDHLKRVLETAFFIVGSVACELKFSIVANILPSRKASLKVLQTDNFYSDLGMSAWKRTFYLYKNGLHAPILLLEYIV